MNDDLVLASDDELPDGHDFVAVRLPDGNCVAFVRESEACASVFAQARRAVAGLSRLLALSYVGVEGAHGVRHAAEVSGLVAVGDLDRGLAQDLPSHPSRDPRLL